MYQCPFRHCDTTSVTGHWCRDQYRHDVVGHSKFLITRCRRDDSDIVLYLRHVRDILQRYQTMEIVCGCDGGYWYHIGSDGRTTSENIFCTHVVYRQYV